MTEVWWKCRVLPFIFIVLSVEAFEFQTQNWVVFDTYSCLLVNSSIQATD